MPWTACIDGRSVGTARERHGRLAARTATDLLRGDVEKLGRRHAPLDESRAAGGHDQRLPVRVGSEDDGRAAVALQLADHLLRQLSELVGVHLLERRHQPRTVDLRHLLHDLLDAGRDVTLPQLAELGLEPLDPFDELARALDRGRRVGAPEGRDQPLEERPLRVDLAERVGTDQGLDAAHTRADRALVQDLDQRNVARAMDVRPAAQLA